MRPLYKTTIVIWTEYDSIEGNLGDDALVVLAREASHGDAYCSKVSSKRIEDPETDPDWDQTEYFNETRE